MGLPLEFFSLNFRFAQRVSEVSGMDLAQALLEYTHIYLAFGLGRSFNPQAAGWQAFLNGLPAATDPIAYIFQSYQEHSQGQPPYQPELAFGCFTYAIWENGRIRLHFFKGVPGQSPLRNEHIQQRRAELKALLEHVRSNVPQASTIVGGSWLYNIEAYRRLFPAGYIATAHPEEPEPQFIAMWGQFLDYHGEVKNELAQVFLQAIQRASNLDEVLHAFPYPVLRLEAPIDIFYQHFAID